MAGSCSIYDPSSGGDVVAQVQMAEDGLYIFDREGRSLHRWRYDEIAHAFAERDARDQVLVQRDRPDIRLNILERALYDGLAIRAPQLRRRPGVKFIDVWEGVPDQLRGGILIALAVGAYFAYRALADLFE